MKFTDKLTIKLTPDQLLKIDVICDKENKIKSSFVRDLIQNEINLYEKQNWKINLSQMSLK